MTAQTLHRACRKRIERVYGRLDAEMHDDLRTLARKERSFESMRRAREIAAFAADIRAAIGAIRSESPALDRRFRRFVKIEAATLAFL